MAKGALFCAMLLALVASPAEAQCPCDCDGDGTTAAAELVRAVAVALGRGGAGTCSAIPGCETGEPCVVAVGGLVRCVEAALSTCSPDVDPTPTPTPIAQDAAAIARALADDIVADVCSGVLGTPGGSFRTTTIDNGGRLFCESFVGHTGTVSITGFASAEEAMAAFGEPGAEEEVVAFGSGTLRILDRVPNCCPSGSQIDWAWLRDCWVVAGHSFDDTGYEFAPRPRQVVEEILASPVVDEFLSFCPSGAGG